MGGRRATSLLAVPLLAQAVARISVALAACRQDTWARRAPAGGWPAPGVGHQRHQTVVAVPCPLC